MGQSAFGTFGDGGISRKLKDAVPVFLVVVVVSVSLGLLPLESSSIKKMDPLSEGQPMFQL